MFLSREKKISEAPKWLMMLVMLKRSERRKRERWQRGKEAKVQREI